MDRLKLRLRGIKACLKVVKYQVVVKILPIMEQV